LIKYALGFWGKEDSLAIDPNIRDRILSHPRARDLEGSEPPQPSLDEVRREIGGPGVSDDEFLLRYIVREEKEIKDQIKAAEKFGSHGWMLWNPRNSYSGEGLKRELRRRWPCKPRKNRDPSHQKNLVFIHHKERIRDDHFVPGIDQCKAGEEKAPGYPSSHHDFIKMNSLLFQMISNPNNRDTHCLLTFLYTLNKRRIIALILSE
jgi:hypothetical protein